MSETDKAIDSAEWLGGSVVIGTDGEDDLPDLEEGSASFVVAFNDVNSRRERVIVFSFLSICRLRLGVVIATVVLELEGAMLETKRSVRHFP